VQRIVAVSDWRGHIDDTVKKFGMLEIRHRFPPV
jgi:hypothetical protein